LGLGYAQIQINNETIIANEKLYFTSVLHELIHASGSFRNYGDRVLAEAVGQLGLNKERPLPARDDIIGNSTYWDKALEDACFR
jgi:hypothetical protein